MLDIIDMVYIVDNIGIIRYSKMTRIATRRFNPRPRLALQTPNINPQIYMSSAYKTYAVAQLVNLMAIN